MGEAIPNLESRERSFYDTMVDERGGDLPEGMLKTSPLLAFTSTRSWTDSVNVVVQLALSMRTHGHGGSLRALQTTRR